MRMPRFETASPVEWCLGGTLTRFRSTTRNVSEGGLLIETLGSAPVGAEVELCLGTRRIRLSGTVARVDARGFAVALGDTKSFGRRRLRRHLRVMG